MERFLSVLGRPQVVSGRPQVVSPGPATIGFGDHFLDQHSKKGIQQWHAKINAEKVLKNNAKMEPKITEFSIFFKTAEKYEIKLPLGQEHDFTGSGCLNIHEKSIQKAYKIDAGKSYAESMENYAQMEPKWRPGSLENLKICEKRHGGNRCWSLKVKNERV